MSSAPEPLTFESFVEDCIFDPDPATLARAMAALEPWREDVKIRLDDYDADSQSWRYYRNTLLSEEATVALSSALDASRDSGSLDPRHVANGCVPSVQAEVAALAERLIRQGIADRQDIAALGYRAQHVASPGEAVREALVELAAFCVARAAGMDAAVGYRTVTSSLQPMGSWRPK